MVALNATTPFILLQFRQAVPSFRFRQQSVHLRKKNIVGPTG